MRPLYITGETGSGKSAIALAVATRTGGEIVNADAYQLYRGLEILSAAPTEAERRAHPHHLYGCLDPTEECHAALFQEIAKPAIAALIERDCLPIVVGGSGLYLKALTHGLSPLPAGDPALREELDALQLPELVDRLQALDPAGARQTNLQNRRYVTRALEICLLSGRPMSEQKTAWRDAEADFDGVLVQRERQDLHTRIDARVGSMFAGGLLEEIAALPQNISVTAGKAIGLREVRALRAGEISTEECGESIRVATRQYAKRQRTWFRRESGFQSVCVAADEDADSAARRALAAFPAHA